MTSLKNNLNKFAIISFSIFVFFFDFLKEIIDLRLIIFFPFFLSIYEQILKNTRINIKLIISILILVTFCILQGQINEMSFDDKIYNLKSILFLSITSWTVWYYSDLILKNLKIFFNFFLIFFFTYLVFFFIYNIDLHISNNQCYIGCFSILTNKLEFYSENSHLGFISSAVIAYLIIKIKKMNIYLISLTLFFCLLILNLKLLDKSNYLLLFG